MQRLALIGVCICLLLLSASVPDALADETEEQPDSAAEPTSSKTLSIAAIAAEATTSDGKKAAKSSVKYPEKLFKKTELDSKKTIDVTFTPLIDGSAAKPQQAMLMLKPAKGPAAYAVAKVKKDGSHVISLTMALIHKQVGKQGGTYDVSLLLGDTSCTAGLSWPLGQLHLPEDPQAAAAPKHLSAAFQPLSNTKPEIVHMFRPAEKTPPAIISLVFAGLTMAPLALLVLALPLLGVNFKSMPGGSGPLWVLLFHGSIAAMLGLYMLFWTSLNLAQTMPLAMGLGVAVAGSGYLALSAVSAERLRPDTALEVKKVQ